MVGSAEAAHAAQVAQLKEDLYSDLTGLILRGVERKDESDIYDCIQTGRNGSKLFPLPSFRSARQPRDSDNCVACSSPFQTRRGQGHGRRRL